MNKALIIVCILISHILYSQGWDFEKPDYKKIENNITKEESNLYYKTLMKRFQQADTTMTLKEKRHLYYGYVYDENYSPYSHSKYADSLSNVLNKEKLDSLDFNVIFDFTNKMLLKNPFDIKALNYQLYSLKQLGDQTNYRKRATQLRIILSALMSSGNGSSKEEAFYVINTSHEYVLLNLLGFEFGGTQSLIEHYDYLTVKENETKLKGLYFDVSPCLKSLSKMLSD